MTEFNRTVRKLEKNEQAQTCRFPKCQHPARWLVGTAFLCLKHARRVVTKATFGQ